LQGGIVVWTRGSQAPSRVLCSTCKPTELHDAWKPLEAHIARVALEAMAAELRRLDGLQHDVVIH
jgi:hypothetical protein